MRARRLRSALALALALAGHACTDLTGSGSGGGSGTPVATSLSFLTQPGPNRVDSLFPTPVQVEVLDQNGAVLISARNAITVALGYNPTGATLLGTTTVAADSGIATFRDLRLDKAGQAFRMRATATGLDTVTSVPFTITP